LNASPCFFLQRQYYELLWYNDEEPCPRASFVGHDRVGMGHLEDHDLTAMGGGERHPPSFDNALRKDREAILQHIMNPVDATAIMAGSGAADKVMTRTTTTRNPDVHASYRNTKTDVDPWDVYDLAAGYVKRGVVVIPVDVVFPTREDHTEMEEEKEEGATKALLLSGDDGANQHEEYAKMKEEIDPGKPPFPSAKRATPSLSIQRSRISLYAAFPPPPIQLPRSNRKNGQLCYDDFELTEAKLALKRFSGWHGAMGMTAATLHREGYADAVLSCNYRWPSLLCVPSLSSALTWIPWKKRRSAAARKYEREHKEWFVGGIHYNIHLGSDNQTSLGGTLSTLDGRTHCRLDVGNPFHPIATPPTRRPPVPVEPATGGILSPSRESDYTLSASRDFSIGSTIPMRLHFIAKYAAMSLPTFHSTSRHEHIHSTPLHLRHFSISLGNLTNATSSRDVPKLTLSLSHGLPVMGGERFWWSQSAPGVDSPDHSNDVELSTVGNNDVPWKRSPAHARSLSLKLDAKQQLSPSQSCHSSIEYGHTDKMLSFGSIFTRSFSSSPFSKAGVGIRHTFGNLFHTGFDFGKGKSNWMKGITWLLFQLERGDVRLQIPIAIRPYPATSWESFLHLCYSSLVTLVVDAIVAELFCGVTSSVCAKLSRVIKGNDFDGAESSVDERNREMGLFRRQQQQAENARDEAYRQRNVMERQAKISVAKEEREEDLVIIKAIYGVMDSESYEWVGDRRLCSMDATAQVQFWVQDSSVHLPAMSKKHMLGFYDVMMGLKTGDWTRDKPATTDDWEKINYLARIVKRWRGSWRSSRLEDKRKLVVVLTVRYKFAGQIFEVMYYDDQAVDLPSSGATIVTI